MRPRLTLLALLIFLLPVTATIASTLDSLFADEYLRDTMEVEVEGGDKWPIEVAHNEINDVASLDIKHLGIDIDRSGEKSFSQDKVPVQSEISPVPLPSAVWLFGSALIGFIGMSRRTRV
jgi:hypothetical protein